MLAKLLGEFLTVVGTVRPYGVIGELIVQAVLGGLVNHVADGCGATSGNVAKAVHHRVDDARDIVFECHEISFPRM